MRVASPRVLLQPVLHHHGAFGDYAQASMHVGLRSAISRLASAAVACEAGMTDNTC